MGDGGRAALHSKQSIINHSPQRPSFEAQEECGIVREHHSTAALDCIRFVRACALTLVPAGLRGCEWDQL